MLIREDLMFRREFHVELDGTSGKGQVFCRT
jgi:hypothetical protein